jgi:hypothetical protein
MRRIVTAAELAGPNFKDDVIVRGQGCKPARVSKTFAHQIEHFQKRLNLPMP